MALTVSEALSRERSVNRRRTGAHHFPIKFRSFGIGDNKTIMSFPMICLASGIILYIIFLMIEILNSSSL